MVTIRSRGLVPSPCSSSHSIGIVSPLKKKERESEVLLSLARFMNNLQQKEKRWEENVIEDNGVWRCAQLRTRGEQQQRGNFILRKWRWGTNRAKGKSLQVGERCEWKRNTKKWKTRERKRTPGERRSDREMESALERRGIYVWVSSAQRGAFWERAKSDTKCETQKELLFERWLMEQRAQNCSIRLSRELCSKNEF